MTLTLACPVGPSAFLQPFAAPAAALSADDAAARLNSAPPPAGGVSAVAVAVGGGVAAVEVGVVAVDVPEGLPVPVPAGAVPPEDVLVAPGSPPAGAAVFVAAVLFAATVSVGLGASVVVFVGAAVVVVVATDADAAPFSPVASLSPPPDVAR